MNQARLAYLDQLARFGKENDQNVTRREDRMLNITSDTGPFLSLLIRATQARTILEIGTSNGYSTIWLADAAQTTGGRVTTVEMNEQKVIQARANFQNVGLDAIITLILARAEEHVPLLQPDSIDFIFLDSERSQYIGWWPLLLAILKPGGLLVVDNAVSHEAELATFTVLVTETAGIETSLVPIGNGELMIWKHR
ncbi:class I SAM-dependent methyltransferase [Spirosoma harenae]